MSDDLMKSILQNLNSTYSDDFKKLFMEEVPKITQEMIEQEKQVILQNYKEMMGKVVKNFAHYHFYKNLFEDKILDGMSIDELKKKLNLDNDLSEEVISDIANKTISESAKSVKEESIIEQKQEVEKIIPQKPVITEEIRKNDIHNPDKVKNPNMPSIEQIMENLQKENEEWALNHELNNHIPTAEEQTVLDSINNIDNMDEIPESQDLSKGPDTPESEDLSDTLLADKQELSDEVKSKGSEYYNKLAQTHNYVNIVNNYKVRLEYFKEREAQGIFRDPFKLYEEDYADVEIPPNLLEHNNPQTPVPYSNESVDLPIVDLDVEFLKAVDTSVWAYINYYNYTAKKKSDPIMTEIEMKFDFKKSREVIYCGMNALKHLYGEDLTGYYQPFVDALRRYYIRLFRTSKYDKSQIESIIMKLIQDMAPVSYYDDPEAINKWDMDGAVKKIDGMSVNNPPVKVIDRID